MRRFCLSLAGLLMLLTGGCGSDSKENQSETPAKANEAEAQNTASGAANVKSDNPPETESQVPENFPGMEGITGTRARNKAKIARSNLRMIGLGCLNFQDLHRFYPFPAGSSYLPKEQQGNLSWRVFLLPMIDQRALYEQFHMDEPWDSEHNLALLDQMPDIYKLSEETKPGYTQYVAPSGTGFIVDGDKARDPKEITDGESNTLIVVTVKPEHAEPWTKPGGVTIDPNRAAEILGGDPNGFLALFGDGSTKTLDPQMDAETLEAILTVAGEEKIDQSKLPPDDFPPDTMKRPAGESTETVIEN